MKTSIVQALLIEREGYLRRGRKDRVAAVDAELKKYGVEVEAKREHRTVEVETAEAKPAETASVKRTKRTAD